MVFGKEENPCQLICVVMPDIGRKRSGVTEKMTSGVGTNITIYTKILLLPNFLPFRLHKKWKHTCRRIIVESCMWVTEHVPGVET